MKTPDPAPALLSTARLAEIRERVSYTVIAEAHNEAIADRAALLAHLDALTPRAVVDGEALGRRLYIEINPGGEQAWPHYAESFRERYIAAALALHAIGYAAGAVAMTGEGDDPGTEGAVLILMRRHDAELHAAHAAGRSEGEAERVRLSALLAAEHESAGVAIEGLESEVARVTEECDAERVAVLDRDATIARLTAALRTETTMKEQVQDQLVEMRGKHREEWERAERLTAELAEARATLDARMGHLDNALATITTASAAARIEGARVEREECARIADAASRYNANRPANTQPSAAYKIADAIRARATEGRQG